MSLFANNTPGPRLCCLCNKRITDPDPDNEACSDRCAVAFALRRLNGECAHGPSSPHLESRSPAFSYKTPPLCSSEGSVIEQQTILTPSVSNYRDVPPIRGGLCAPHPPKTPESHYARIVPRRPDASAPAQINGADPYKDTFDFSRFSPPSDAPALRKAPSLTKTVKKMASSVLRRKDSSPSPQSSPATSSSWPQSSTDVSTASVKPAWGLGHKLSFRKPRSPASSPPPSYSPPTFAYATSSPDDWISWMEDRPATPDAAVIPPAVRALRRTTPDVPRSVSTASSLGEWATAPDFGRPYTPPRSINMDDFVLDIGSNSLREDIRPMPHAKPAVHRSSSSAGLMPVYWNSHSARSPRRAPLEGTVDWS